VSFELQFTSAYSAQSGYSVNLAFSNARRVNAFAITQLAFGVPTVTPAIHPSGINDEAFGSTVASADAWIVNNTGFTQLAFGTASITMYVLETGFNTYSPGSTTVSGLNTIAPSGIASAEAFGTPELRDVTVADVALFVATSYGTASLSRTLPTSSGIPAGGIGHPGIDLYTRYLLPVGFFREANFGFGLDGDGRIEFANRTVRTTGWVDDHFGDLESSGGLRGIDQAGRGVQPPGFGTQFIAFAERRLFPLGLSAGLVSRNVEVGFNQFASPDGWDNLAFGDTVVTDNTQQAHLTGFAASAYGLPQVDPNPRSLRPLGIFENGVYPHGSFGVDEVRNSTRILQQTFDDLNTDYLEAFGDPIHTTVENVDRVIGAVGERMDRMSILATVENAATPVAPVGWDSGIYGFGLGLHPDGEGFIAYANRSFTVPGPFDAIGPEIISPFHQVTRTPEIDAPSLGTQLAFGLARVVNTRRTFPIASMGETQVWGLPRTEHRIRTLAPDGLDAYGFGIPDVENNTRYLGASSVNPPLFAFGADNLDIHFTIVGTHGQTWGAMNDAHRVTNRTPELRAYWTDSTFWGGNAIHNQNNYAAIQGFEQLFFGHTNIGERTQRPQPRGFDTERISPFTNIRNDTPDPPPTRLVLTPSVYDHDHFGSHVVTWNSIYPSGAVMTLFGHPTVHANSLYPSGFWKELEPGGQFGTARLNATQYIDVDGGGVVPPGMGTARIDPFTIYCTLNVPPHYEDGLTEGVNRWRLMDRDDDGTRPFFGSPDVSNQIRSVAPYHVDNHSLDHTIGELFGTSHIELGARTVHVTGIKSQRIGFPVITHGGEINLDDFHYGIASDEEYGEHTISQETNPQYARVSGIAPGQVGNNDAQNLNRTLALTGWDSARYGTAPWPYVTPPNFRYMNGFIATVWGDHRIEYRVRTTVTTGALDEAFGPSADEFAGRMHVSRRQNFGVQGIAPGGLGTPGVTRAVRGISGVGLMDTSIVSHGGDVRRLNIIALGGYGWLDEDFGDAWRVEDGMIKCRGWLDGALGNNGKLARTLPANGWNDTVFGDNHAGQVIYGAGFEQSAFGAHVATGDGLEFTCGQRPRALVAHAIPSTLVFGNPTVVEQFSLHPSGFSDEAFGTAQLDRTLPQQGWDDTVFGTASNQMNVTATGWTEAAYGVATIVMKVVVGAGIYDEAFGLPQLNLNIAGSGFTDEAFGTARITMNVVVGSGINDEAFGTPQLNMNVVVGSGINDEAFGTAKLDMNIAGSGFTQLAFGVAQLNMNIATTGWLDEAWWANYCDTNDYAASDYFANDNAHKVAHA
jgi:hypothetical protein